MAHVTIRVHGAYFGQRARLDTAFPRWYEPPAAIRPEGRAIEPK
jgi:hypothetical protein